MQRESLVLERDLSCMLDNSRTAEGYPEGEEEMGDGGQEQARWNLLGEVERG